MSLLVGLTVGPAARADEGPSSSTVCPAPDPDCDYTSIQAAVDAARTGGTVLVSAGTYDESVTVTTPMILCSRDGTSSRCADGRDDAVVDARGRNAPAVTVAADGVAIRGFTLLSGHDTTLLIEAESTLVADNVLHGTEAAVHLREGTGQNLIGNAYVGVPTGLVIEGAAGIRSLGETFVGVVTGVELRAGPGGQPDGVLVRDADFKAAVVAVRLSGSDGAEVRDVVVDARNNDWGVYVDPLVKTRVIDGGEGNTVLQVPFRMPR